MPRWYRHYLERPARPAGPPRSSRRVRPRWRGPRMPGMQVPAGARARRPALPVRSSAHRSTDRSAGRTGRPTTMPAWCPATSKSAERGRAWATARAPARSAPPKHPCHWLLLCCWHCARAGARAGADKSAPSARLWARPRTSLHARPSSAARVDHVVRHEAGNEHIGVVVQVASQPTARRPARRSTSRRLRCEWARMVRRPSRPVQRRRFRPSRRG